MPVPSNRHDEAQGEPKLSEVQAAGQNHQNPFNFIITSWILSDAMAMKAVEGLLIDLPTIGIRNASEKLRDAVTRILVPSPGGKGYESHRAKPLDAVRGSIVDVALAEVNWTAVLRDLSKHLSAQSEGERGEGGG